MELGAWVLFLCFAGILGEDIATIVPAEDDCAEWECSLKLHQLRAKKVDHLASGHALDDSETEDHDERFEGSELGAQSGSCRNSADMKVWRGGGKETFNPSLDHCARSCRFVGPWYAGLPCTRDCMQKKGYSRPCATCMAELVDCKREHCLSPCFNKDDDPECVHCTKSSCRHQMKLCSGLKIGGR
ncbi:unnamed protein product [Symbiodinium natans]|uniref:TNFR-Cys domain-containing protein n=1 Tax=Symbiodinium natans TaxID=878477 RepID=A0A812V1H1_9DINO|nr:unnamed protein product [Symbiodinium natans]